MTAKDEALRKANDTVKSGLELLKTCKVNDAKAAFRAAYQLYRKHDKDGEEIHEAAFLLALCIVEGINNHDELVEAEERLIPSNPRKWGSGKNATAPYQY